MTKNSPALLADLLEGYAVPAGYTPQVHRGFEGDDQDIAAWRRHNADIDLVRSIDNLLIGMEAAGEDVGHFQECLGDWYSGVHFAATPWGTALTRVSKACNAGSIRMLRALSSVLKANGGLTISEAARRQLSDTLEQARELIEEDIESFSPDVRHYLLALIHRAQSVINDVERYGSETVRQVALELSGAVQVQADVVESINPEKASRLRAVAGMLAGGFLGKFGESGADAVVSGLGDAARAITG